MPLNQAAGNDKIMNKLSANEKRQLRKRVEQSVNNAAAARKQIEKPVGRASPHPRPSLNPVTPPYSGVKNGEIKSTASSTNNAPAVKKVPSTRAGQNAIPTPFVAVKNGDAKPNSTSGSRPYSAANSKPPQPWQRPKVTPASAAYGRNENSPKYANPASRRVSGGQARSSSPASSNPPRPSLSANQKNRSRAASSVAPNNSPASSTQANESRSRASSTPSTKASEVAKKPPQNTPKSDEKLAVSYSSGDSAVALPKIKQTDATLETKKTESKPEQEEKLLAVPKRSRAHVMPVARTTKPAKKGHDFQPHELTDWVNWCDACGSIILSLFGKCVRCKKCKMVCHGKCASTVSLTCEADEIRALSQIDPSWYKTIVEETKDEATLKEYNTIHRVMPKGEIKERIEKFNKTVKSTQQMTLQEDGETFRGFIRVTMNLTRPVSVAEKEKKKLQRSASFYVNKGAVKALYLSSNTTAEEVVSALLNKYGIRDNPLKFALFEKQVREEGHIILRKMMTRERPLFLRLLWGDGSTQQHAFILQENESREIQWETFSLPELKTFLKILEKEQDDHIACIKTKYDSRRQDLVNAMNYRKKQGTK